MLQFLCKHCHKAGLKVAKMSQINRVLFTQKALFFLASVRCKIKALSHYKVFVLVYVNIQAKQLSQQLALCIFQSI